MANFPPAVHDVFNLDDLLNEEEREIRYRVRAFMVSLQSIMLVVYRAPVLLPPRFGFRM
jgi:hypothetical protein